MKQFVLFELDGVLLDENSFAQEGASRFLSNLKKARVTTVAFSREEESVMESSLASAGLAVDRVVSAVGAKEEKLPLLASLAVGADVSSCLVVVSDKPLMDGSLADGFTTLTVTNGIDAVTASPSFAIISSLEAISDFSDASSFDDILSSLSGSDESVLYGRNRVAKGRELRPMSDQLKTAFRMACLAREHAYAPYSHFRVGAALVSAATGRIYSGCNVENSSFGATICAERNAVLNAIATEGVIGIDLLVVVTEQVPPAPPCAVCLQVLSEFCRSDTSVHLMSPDGKSDVSLRFRDLLPLSFSLGKS